MNILIYFFLIFCVNFDILNSEVCEKCQQISGGAIYPQELRSHGTHNLHISKARSRRFQYSKNII